MDEELIAEKKQVWLESLGYTFKDVMSDEDGEYVINITEMDEGEGGDYGAKKIYLPDFSQEIYE